MYIYIYRYRYMYIYIDIFISIVRYVANGQVLVGEYIELPPLRMHDRHTSSHSLLRLTPPQVRFTIRYTKEGELVAGHIEPYTPREVALNCYLLIPLACIPNRYTPAASMLFDVWRHRHREDGSSVQGAAVQNRAPLPCKDNIRALFCFLSHQCGTDCGKYCAVR